MKIVRVLLVILLASAGSAALAVRSALLIAVDRYAFSPKSPDPSMALSGAKNDLKAMVSLVQDGFGYSVEPLLQSDAKRAKISAWLNGAAASAQSGDRFLFYFSGCGSLTPNPGGDGPLIPTLIPADGLPNSSQNDIPMTALEDFAAKLKQKGASAIFIVDAAFCQIPISKDFDFKPWKRGQRSWQRGDTDSSRLPARLYNGPGVFLSACGPSGSAYEDRPTPEADSWTGAFTQFFADEAGTELLAGQRCAPKDVTMHVRMEFQPLLKANYFKAELPPNPISPIDPGYEQPMGDASTMKLAFGPYAQRIKARRQKELQSFRFAIDFPQESPSGLEPFRSTGNDLISALQAKDQVFRHCDRGDVPDIAIKIVSLDPLKVEIEGDLLGSASALDEKQLSGDSVAEIADQLTPRFREALLSRVLFNYLASPDHLGPVSGFSATPWSLRYVLYGDQEKVKEGLDLVSPASGSVIAFDQNDSNGAFEVWCPTVYATTIHTDPGPSKYPPAKPYTFKKRDPDSHTVLYALFIPSSIALPPLPPSAGNLDPDLIDKSADFHKALLELLTRLQEIVIQGKGTWASSRVEWDEAHESGQGA